MNFLETKVEKDGEDVYVNEGSFRLKVLPEQAQFLTPYIGKSVVFGIRPEDVTFSKDPQDGLTINGHVSVVEPLGAETHVYVATSKGQVIGRIDPKHTIAVDTKISLIPDMHKAKFFDADTELVIGSKKPLMAPTVKQGEKTED